jgi:hypothetical protein
MEPKFKRGPTGPHLLYLDKWPIGAAGDVIFKTNVRSYAELRALPTFSAAWEEEKSCAVAKVLFQSA